MEGPLLMNPPHALGFHAGFSPFAAPYNNPMPRGFGFGYSMNQHCMSPPSDDFMGSHSLSPRSSHSLSPRGTNTSVRFITKLGAGAFGEVWKAEYEGEIVAAKVTGCPTGFRREELDILRAVQGPHTVRLIAEEHGTSKGTAIIMQLYEGSLQDRLDEFTSEDPTKRGFLQDLHEILTGLAALHADGIVFGDLKPDNLLLEKEGRVVFADFGDARDMNVSMLGRSVHELGWGSPMYHARPDVLQQQLTTASDMWMLAQTSVQMWTLDEPRTNPSPLPSDLPLRSLLERCFSHQPDERPTARELLQQCARELKWCGVEVEQPRTGLMSRRASMGEVRPPERRVISPDDAVVQPQRRRNSVPEAANEVQAISTTFEPRPRLQGIVFPAPWHSPGPMFGQFYR